MDDAHIWALIYIEFGDDNPTHAQISKSQIYTPIPRSLNRHLRHDSIHKRNIMRLYFSLTKHSQFGFR